MADGTLLSGWCLPGMSADQHGRCRFPGCPCTCGHRWTIPSADIEAVLREDGDATIPRGAP